MVMQWPERLFITGIDTDAGKSYVTGRLAVMMMQDGLNPITQKFVQTGNRDVSEDIEVHRRIMGTGMLPVDKQRLTAPLIYTYPASPELAASIDGTVVDTDRIAECTDLLLREYDHVLIEGAGGLMVPLKGDYLTIDYIRDHNLPVVLVTNATLGSINHTLLALDAINTHGLKLFAVVFNHHFDNDKPIAEDTHRYVKSWVERHNTETLFIDVESLT